MQAMQSALDAKAFAAISESIAQLLLLKEVLCTSELGCLSDGSEAPHHSEASRHGMPGMHTLEQDIPVVNTNINLADVPRTLTCRVKHNFVTQREASTEMYAEPLKMPLCFARIMRGAAMCRWS